MNVKTVGAVKDAEKPIEAEKEQVIVKEPVKEEPATDKVDIKPASDSVEAESEEVKEEPVTSASLAYEAKILKSKEDAEKEQEEKDLADAIQESVMSIKKSDLFLKGNKPQVLLTFSAVGSFLGAEITESFLGIPLGKVKRSFGNIRIQRKSVTSKLRHRRQEALRLAKEKFKKKS